MSFDTIIPTQSNASTVNISQMDIGAPDWLRVNAEHAVLGAGNLTIQAEQEANLMLSRFNIGNFASPDISAEEANKKYPIPDKPYTQPVPEREAQLRYTYKQNEDQYQDMLQSYVAPHWYSPRNVAGFVENAGLMVLDPVSTSLMLIPGVGEESLAARVALPTTGLLERTGIRATIGAIKMGQFAAPTLAARAVMGADQGSPMSAGDIGKSFLEQLAFGAIFHTGMGVFSDIGTKFDAKTQQAMAEATLRAESGQDALKNVSSIIEISKPVHEWEIKNGRRFNFQNDYKSLGDFLDEKWKNGGLSGDLNDLIAMRKAALDLKRPPILSEVKDASSAIAAREAEIAAGTAQDVKPWEMTKAEYDKATPESETKMPHERLVMDAVDKGEPVPSRVIKEYPYLENVMKNRFGDDFQKLLDENYHKNFAPERLQEQAKVRLENLKQKQAVEKSAIEPIKTPKDNSKPLNTDKRIARVSEDVNRLEEENKTPVIEKSKTEGKPTEVEKSTPDLIDKDAKITLRTYFKCAWQALTGGASE